MKLFNRIPVLGASAISHTISTGNGTDDCTYFDLTIDTNCRLYDVDNSYTRPFEDMRRIQSKERKRVSKHPLQGLCLSEPEHESACNNPISAFSEISATKNPAALFTSFVHKYGNLYGPGVYLLPDIITASKRLRLLLQLIACHAQGRPRKMEDGLLMLKTSLILLVGSRGSSTIPENNYLYIDTERLVKFPVPSHFYFHYLEPIIYSDPDSWNTIQRGYKRTEYYIDRIEKRLMERWNASHQEDFAVTIGDEYDPDNFAPSESDLEVFNICKKLFYNFSRYYFSESNSLIFEEDGCNPSSEIPEDISVSIMRLSEIVMETEFKAHITEESGLDYAVDVKNMTVTPCPRNLLGLMYFSLLINSEDEFYVNCDSKACKRVAFHSSKSIDDYCCKNCRGKTNADNAKKARDTIDNMGN